MPPPPLLAPAKGSGGGSIKRSKGAIKGSMMKGKVKGSHKGGYRKPAKELRMSRSMPSFQIHSELPNGGALMHGGGVVRSSAAAAVAAANGNVSMFGGGRSRVNSMSRQYATPSQAFPARLPRLLPTNSKFVKHAKTQETAPERQYLHNYSAYTQIDLINLVDDLERETERLNKANKQLRYETNRKQNSGEMGEALMARIKASIIRERDSQQSLTEQVAHEALKTNAAMEAVEEWRERFEGTLAELDSQQKECGYLQKQRDEINAKLLQLAGVNDDLEHRLNSALQGMYTREQTATNDKHNEEQLKGEIKRTKNDVKQREHEISTLETKLLEEKQYSKSIGLESLSFRRKAEGLQQRLVQRDDDIIGLEEQIRRLKVHDSNSIQHITALTVELELLTNQQDQRPQSVQRDREVSLLKLKELEDVQKRMVRLTFDHSKLADQNAELKKQLMELEIKLTLAQEMATAAEARAKALEPPPPSAENGEEKEGKKGKKKRKKKGKVVEVAEEEEKTAVEVEKPPQEVPIEVFVMPPVDTAAVPQAPREPQPSPEEPAEPPAEPPAKPTEPPENSKELPPASSGSARRSKTTTPQEGPQQMAQRAKSRAASGTTTPAGSTPRSGKDKPRGLLNPNATLKDKELANAAAVSDLRLM